MAIQGWLLIILFVGVLLAIAKPIGLWLFALYEGRRTPLHIVLGPFETSFYKFAGIDPNEEQGWRRYAVHMLLFNMALLLFTYAVVRLQAVLPMNTPKFAGVTPDGAFNIATSFTTNINWQWYSGESTLSNLSQMLGLVIHNFTSSATGIALAFALFRGFARRQTANLGNFWADCARITLYLLLPISIVYAVYLIWSGVPQTFDQQIVATTIEGANQTIALGPVASQEAIKMIGTNGGGFYNGNSAHPFENPTALTNLVQMLSIFAVGFGLTWCFGKAVGKRARAGRFSRRCSFSSSPESRSAIGRKRVPALARFTGRVITHAHLLKAAWTQQQDGHVEYLRVLVRGIRQKLETDPSKPAVIVNELGIGYRLMAPDD